MVPFPGRAYRDLQCADSGSGIKMNVATVAPWAAIGLVLAKAAAQLWLDYLNRKHVLAYAGAVPEPFKEIIDEPAYAKSTAYTLAKGRLDQIDTIYSAAILIMVLFSGMLPWWHGVITGWFGASA